MSTSQAVRAFESLADPQTRARGHLRADDRTGGGPRFLQPRAEAMDWDTLMVSERYMHALSTLP